MLSLLVTAQKIDEILTTEPPDGKINSSRLKPLKTLSNLTHQTLLIRSASSLSGSAFSLPQIC